jgi:hypothetical protein
MKMPGALWKIIAKGTTVNNRSTVRCRAHAEGGERGAPSSVTFH